MIEFDFDQSTWGSRIISADGTKLPWMADKNIIHWGGNGRAEETVEDEMARLQAWQNYHMDTKGWTDIAYNYAVGNTGNVYRLRGENRSGATSGDFEDDGIKENHEGRAIVWIGGALSVPTQAARDSMTRVIRESGHNLVIGHKNVKGTSCPGPDWMQYIADRPWDLPLPPESEPELLDIPDPRAQEAWDWAEAEGLLSSFSKPHDMVDKQELMMFLKRYNERA